MQESEFNIVKDISNMHLPPQRVMIIILYGNGNGLVNQHLKMMTQISETYSEGFAALNPDTDSDITDDGFTETSTYVVHCNIKMYRDYS